VPGEVIGRAGELAAIEQFLADLDERPSALVFEGDPGIGKTTLMRAGVEAAEARGAHVLACAASASETRLSYAALADLVGDLAGELSDPLPAPQRDALDAALLRSGSGAGSVDRRAVAMAVLSMLEALAARKPVVVAIDDVQWLDRPSAHVVAFCTRRLADRVGLFASLRVGHEVAWVTDLVRTRMHDRAELLRLAPLGPAELQRLLRERLPRSLDLPTLARVHEASGGNPFYALELARALPAGAPPSPALPLPASLGEVVAARLAGLDPDVEEALLAVAALADPGLALLEHALGPQVLERLDQAEGRGMIELEGSRVRFTHPLLAGGVYARATSGRRRAMHRRLSAVVADKEERARHLAFAGDPEARDALEDAARHVNARGAPDVAAELLELALEHGGGHHLRLPAAQHHFDAGETRRARALLEEEIAALPAGPERARARMLLAEVRFKDDSFPAARELLEQARADAGADRRLQVMIDLRLTPVLFNVGAPADAVAPARAALEQVQRLDEPGLLAQALACSVIVGFCIGLGLDEQRLATARALERSHPLPGVELRPSLIATWVFLWTGRLEEARASVQVATAHWAERGDEHALAWVDGFLHVWLECWAGDLERASAIAGPGVERLLMLETTSGSALAHSGRAMLDAYAGRVEDARRGCAEALALFDRAGWESAKPWALTTAGFLEMSIGDHEAAAATLAPMAALTVESGMPEPCAGGWTFTGDAAEAFVAVGRMEEAKAIVRLLQRRGAELDRAWAIAVGARCRGLVLAAEGDVSGAERAIQQALVAHRRLPIPIERGRSLLALGRIRRRRGKRLAAKAALEEALAIFETASSPRWAEQASEEIARLGLRPRAAYRLTPSEERVAQLAASGLTNREVATSLLVSPKTVEAHLARAYRKLGIRSRAELGARMAGPDTS
jgi:DNA-binding CsgD family transcriptional regulator